MEAFRERRARRGSQNWWDEHGKSSFRKITYEVVEHFLDQTTGMHQLAPSESAAPGVGRKLHCLHVRGIESPFIADQFVFTNAISLSFASLERGDTSAPAADELFNLR